MQNLNLSLDYFDHPKTRRLIGLLGRGAAELPIRLWCYCGKHHAESGSLASYSAQEIESIVGWWGKTGELVGAMVKVGFLEVDGDGWKIRDWSDQNGHLAAFKARAKTAAAARWGKLSNATSNAKSKHKQFPNQPPKPTNQLTNKPTISEKKEIAPPSSEAQPAPKAKGKQRRYLPEHFQRAKEFMLTKWKYKNGPYLFSAGDGALLSRLLGNYGVHKTMAILDLFWQESAGDEWFKDKRDYRGLSLMLPKLMDNGRLGALEKKYQSEEPKNPEGIKSVEDLAAKMLKPVDGQAHA